MLRWLTSQRLWVARDVDAEVKILSETWGDYDSVGIRAVTRFDTALLQSKAVTVLTEATGSEGASGASGASAQLTMPDEPNTQDLRGGCGATRHRLLVTV